MKGELETEESLELENWLEEDPKNRELFSALNDPALQKKDFEYFMGKDISGSWENVSLSINSKKKKNPRIYKWWAIAASLLLVVSLFSWWRIAHKHTDNDTLLSKNDIYPGSYNAVLIDDKGISHHLQKDSGSQVPMYVSNTSNGLFYNHLNAVAQGNNTLIVPIKGIFHVRLSDGTEVWLHPSTTFNYPIVFSGKERRVNLTGDAFFKVAKNNQMPFRVYCNGVMTEAVGTEFNITSNDSGCTTSLVQGKVKVSNAHGSTMMQPGSSLRISSFTVPGKTQTLDTTISTTWKNGDFHFRSTPLKEVMATLAGWYGVSVKYEDFNGLDKKTFNGVLPRDVSLGENLKTMELTTIAKFKVQNNTIYIFPSAVRTVPN
ncbi:FecR family protein [Rhizosphaericola mali]|nr:FecR family protein [Rhizosphaericola mali]